MRKISWRIMLLLVLAAAGCTETPASQLPLSNHNDLARFLAGMPVREESPLHRLTLTPAFREHAAQMDRFWSIVLRENVYNIIPWRNHYIIPRYNYKTAFYPLSGGDFINLYLLYPMAQRYIMISLEPAGRVPDPLGLSPDHLLNGLRTLRGTIGNIAAKNYMMSAVMKSGMINPYMEGTLPVFLLLAARLELNITKIEPVGLTARGEVRPLDGNGTIGGARPYAPGNRIVFRATPSGPDRELLYLSMRLQHDSMNPSTPEGKFLSAMSGLNVIVKSAFYLLHRPGYEEFCRSLLDRANLLVQDDSGIPYRFLTNDAWLTVLFGMYERPLALRDMKHPAMQKDLAEEYRQSRLPLPFNFGYGSWRSDGKSNLILAIRKSPLRPR